MKPGSAKYKDIPLIIAGSTNFGRYGKMSSEQTFNFILSEASDQAWLIPFAGYKMINEINPGGVGRGIYSSAKQQKMFVVVDNQVYMYDTSLNRLNIGTLQSYSGDVFISENNAGQILFSDGPASPGSPTPHLYIYDTALAPNFQTSGITPGFTIDFYPGYITFQNGRFVSPSAQIAQPLNNFQWRLSDPNNGRSWPNDSQHVGQLQTKPDKTVATIRFPGRGNLLLVFGATVAEQWQDAGAQLFPYQRSQSNNIDYGCLNPATIAESENIVVWVSANEKSGPVISYTNGGEIKHISTDGINYKLANLANPTNCYGFIFKQDGHLIYVATWPTDNLSYCYDFNTDKFFTLTDENMNAFIAKRVSFFNNQYYFVSLRDGNLYQLNSSFYTYDYGNDNVFEIPRIRICNSIALPDQSRFIAGYAGFTIEQGQFDYPDRDTRFILGTEDTNEISTQNHNVLIGGGQDFTSRVPTIDMSLSKDGGYNFGSVASIIMKPLGRRANKIMWWRLGASNDLVHQFRFNGFGRFIAANGICGVYQ